jgi:RNA polymerase sigma-70 factor (ECF subfamily)
MIPSHEERQFTADVARIYPELRRRAERLTQNQSDAEDLLHDALERGFKNRESFRTGGSPERWLKTIMLRVFIDGRRQAKRRPSIPCQDPDSFAAHEEPEADCGAARFSPEDLERAVARLPTGFRTVYAAFAFEQRSHAEIAQRFSLPVGTVGTRILRARAKLRALLESEAERPTLRVVRGGAGATPEHRAAPARRTPSRAMPAQRGTFYADRDKHTVAL